MRRHHDLGPGRLLGWRDHEIRDEIDFYLEERTRELEQRGLAPDEARRRALEAFGDPERVVERVQREWWGSRMNRGGRMITELWQDFRYALRTLVREPVFATAACITLALAIGANAAIFGIVDATLLRKPPVRDPESLVSVYTTCRAGDPRCSSSYPDYLDYRQVSALDDLAGYSWLSVSGADAGQPPRLLSAMQVTGNYFDMLGVPAALGRVIQPGDDRPESTAAVVVLSQSIWREGYGADPAVLGRTLRLNDVPFEIIGVAPEGFRGIALNDDPDVFLPLTSRNLLDIQAVGGVPIWESRQDRWIDRLVGRLAPDESVEQLQVEMNALADRLNEAYPAERLDRRITVDPSSRYSLPAVGREELGRLVSALAAVVGLTLLLAVANVANLLLARTGRRQKEMGVRLALGSSAARLIRQLLVESVTLAVIGGAAGLVVALVLIRLMSGFDLPGGVPLAILGVGVDGRVFAFALGLATATGMAFGVVPALRAARRAPLASLRNAAHTSGREGDRLRKALVSVQVCACLVLLIGGGTFLRGLRSGLTYDMGMRPEGLALAQFDFGRLNYEPGDAIARIDEILARARALPAVTSAAITTTVPLQAGRNMGVFVTVDGYEPSPDEEMRAEVTFVTEDFFRTLGTRLLAGREWDATISSEDGLQVVINRRMAESYWAEGNALDGVVGWNIGGMRVVGVTEDVAWRTIPQPPLNFLTVPVRQLPQFGSNGSVTLMSRTSGDAKALLAPIRRIVLDADPNVTFDYVQTMEDVLGSRLSPQRMGSLLFVAFGGLALVLAVVGIGGVVAYVVGRQKREIGIRMALGASRGQVQRSAMYGMLLPIGIGLGAGVFLAVRLGRSIQAFLVEASATDPWTYAAAAGVLALATLVAAWIPARRASKVDPVRVLKAE